MAKQPSHVKQDRIGPTFAEVVFTELLEGGERGPLPYNPKWRNLEEQSYIVLATLRLLRSYLEGRFQRGLNSEAVQDCLSLLDPVIKFLDAVDLTALVMEKERAAWEKRGNGKAA